MPHVSSAQLEALIAMLVHDLRNPAASFAANLDFVKSALSDPSVPQTEIFEALGDSGQAFTELSRGLDQLSWIGRWFNDQPAFPQTAQDVKVALEGAKRRIKHGQVDFALPSEPLRVQGGEALERLIELLVCNGFQYAPRKPVRVQVVQEDSRTVIEIEDEGRPLAPELRASAFTLSGQTGIKGRSDGRYGRAAGLFAAAILAQAIGAELGAAERAGRNVFRITLATPADGQD